MERYSENIVKGGAKSANAISYYRTRQSDDNAGIKAQKTKVLRYALKLEYTLMTDDININRKELNEAKG